MLRAAPPGHPLQKPTVVQWDIGGMLSADGAADESVSPQSGISGATKPHLRSTSMSDLIVYGFPRSTFVNIVRLVLTHKEVPYTFHDLEPQMGKPSHLALHPFNRVPILRLGDFTVYETSAIVS